MRVCKAVKHIKLASPSIFCHFLTLVTSLLNAGLLSEAEVLAPGVPALETTNPYLSVTTLTGVLVTASDVASALANAFGMFADA